MISKKTRRVCFSALPYLFSLLLISCGGAGGILPLGGSAPVGPPTAPTLAANQENQDSSEDTTLRDASAVVRSGDTSLTVASAGSPLSPGLPIPSAGGLTEDNLVVTDAGFLIRIQSKTLTSTEQTYPFLDQPKLIKAEFSGQIVSFPDGEETPCCQNQWIRLGVKTSYTPDTPITQQWLLVGCIYLQVGPEGNFSGSYLSPAEPTFSSTAFLFDEGQEIVSSECVRREELPPHKLVAVQNLAANVQTILGLPFNRIPKNTVFPLFNGGNTEDKNP